MAAKLVRHPFAKGSGRVSNPARNLRREDVYAAAEIPVHELLTIFMTAPRQSQCQENTGGEASPLSAFGAGLAMESGRFWMILTLVLALASGVRFYRLGQDDYWLDELHSFANSAAKRADFENFIYGEIFLPAASPTSLGERSTFATVWRGMRDDSHPPLYFLLLRYWRQLVGDGEFAVRALSAILSALSTVPVALLLKRAGQPRAGLIAALVLALAFSSIFVAQQNRQYSLALLLLGCSYLALYEMQPKNKAIRQRELRGGDNDQGSSSLFKGGLKGVEPSAPDIANPVARSPCFLCLPLVYAATLYLCMMSHYFCALPLATHAVYAAVFLRGRALRHWLAASFAAGALFAVTWGPVLVAQLDFIRDQPWLSESGEGHLTKTLARLTDVPARLLIPLDAFHLSWRRSLIGISLLVATTTLLIWRLRKPQAPEAKRVALLMSLWFASPIIAFALLDLGTSKQLLNHLRYPVIAVPGLAGMIGLAIASFSKKWSLWTAVLLAITMVSVLRWPATSNADARQATAELASRARPKDLIIFDAIGWPKDWIPQFFAPMRYYMGGHHPSNREHQMDGWHGQAPLARDRNARRGPSRFRPDAPSGESVSSESDAGGWPNPMLLLREPPSQTLIAQISRYDRFWVVCPRVDENNRPIIPNHSPATHVLKANSAYIWQIGWIYLFERTGDTAPDGSSPRE